MGLVGATAIGAAVDGTSGGDAVADQEPAGAGTPGSDLRYGDTGRFGGRSDDDGVSGEGYAEDGRSEDTGRSGRPAPPQWGDAAGSGSTTPGGGSGSSAPSTRSSAS